MIYKKFAESNSRHSGVPAVLTGASDTVLRLLEARANVDEPYVPQVGLLGILHRIKGLQYRRGLKLNRVGQ